MLLDTLFQLILHHDKNSKLTEIKGNLLQIVIPGSLNAKFLYSFLKICLNLNLACTPVLSPCFICQVSRYQNNP